MLLKCQQFDDWLGQFALWDSINKPSPKGDATGKIFSFGWRVFNGKTIFVGRHDRKRQADSLKQFLQGLHMGLAQM